ncbi:hypothetical protein AK973_1168 [Pseudomonas brassicacearum]|nr:hypothetical protein AK973_1168 [Pseudomonas brassicacearum]
MRLVAHNSYTVPMVGSDTFSRCKKKQPRFLAALSMPGMKHGLWDR